MAFKLVFAGTANFAVPSLRALRAGGHDVALVITQPDRPAGRGMKATPPPVKTEAEALGLDLVQPDRIRDAEVVDRLHALAPDVMVVVAYGQIIPASILAIPRRGAVNVHASLLPRWRGAAPVARAILAGDQVTGVTIMLMDEQLDHGPVFGVRSTPIGERENAAQLSARLSSMGAELLVDVLSRLDEIQPTAQDHGMATLAPKLRRQEGQLEWSMGPQEIDRRVRGLQPWPGATLPTARGRVKVLSGHIEDDRYVPDVVQVPGKRPAPAKQVLRDA